MRVLVMYSYPPNPAGLSTQGDLLFRGLGELGVEAHAVHFESAQEKEWYYRWFEPDVAVGWGSGAMPLISSFIPSGTECDPCRG